MNDKDIKLLNHKQPQLEEYDYSKVGAYFITVCTKDRKLDFEDAKIKRVVESFWLKIPEQFSNVELGNYVIMPNHLHGILINVVQFIESPFIYSGVINHAPTLGEIIRWFKGRVKFEIERRCSRNFQWQQNYYGHSIRDVNELLKIRKYIMNTFHRWNEDAENPENREADTKIDTD